MAPLDENLPVPERPRRRFAGIALLLLPAMFLAPGIPASADEPLEYQVKAAFLLNFTKFVEWPATAFPEQNSPLTICIVGADPFGNTLNEMVKGEAVNGHPIVIEKVAGTLTTAKSCQVLFVKKSEKDTSRIVAVSGPGVLTVGEGEDFIRDGGIVAFVVDNRRVRFDIDQRAAAKAMLTISSRLMNVARYVER